jgi:hypothetical protein
MADTEFVRVRECPDGSHPEGDGVWIASRLSLECGMAARADILRAQKDAGPDASDEDVWSALFGRWMQTYARLAPVSWNLHDEEHVTKDNPSGEWPFEPARLLEDFELGFPVADRADDLYREAVMRPLGEAPSTTSRRGTNGSTTSARTTSTGKSRGRSSRPSTAGTPSPGLTA